MKYIIRLSHFGEDLKRLRYRKELSQKQLAHMIGIGRITIGSYETGNREPTAYSVCKLMKPFKDEIKIKL
jgi:transcriptional regulator with XRE-family HTH domain